MPTVHLAFSPAPQYVRTARLVSVAVARRAGVADELLDWVRLAVGDACGRAVARHVRYGVDELIQVIMSDGGPYEVRVIDACGTDIAEEPQVAAEDPAVAEDADRMGETLLAGLVEDLQVTRGPEGTEVRMAWPVRRRLSEAARTRHGGRT